MLKWIGRILLITILGGFSFEAYQMYRGGYFSLPDLADDEYPISFRSGFRAIVPLPEDLRHSAPTSKFLRRLAWEYPDRQYLGIPVNVPSWFEDKWSKCISGNQAENVELKAQIEQGMTDKLRNDLVGARLDAVCGFELDDGSFRLRGYIFSVPKL
ncbi:hypothetical protein [Pontitalea aquivivens]|uniref:hypothetical protein n=1 Tax=Pontitalea aquivivens TaxID=3388663 RepID=UPI0039704AD0